VLLIGPGLGLEEETKELVKLLLNKNKNKKIVIDADAIKALAKTKLNKNVLITPHKKELEIFSGLEIKKDYKDRINKTKKIALKYNCNILLKGPIDIITNGKEIYYNATGNSSMTTAGTGDVLAGLCAAFAAKNNLLESAKIASFLNGYCGDTIYKKREYLLASDIIEEIPKAIKELKENSGTKFNPDIVNVLMKILEEEMHIIVS
jgi:NAD(P)H-hydrate epimerase